jgi:hypothetical protein
MAGTEAATMAGAGVTTAAVFTMAEAITAAGGMVVGEAVDAATTERRT